MNIILIKKTCSLCNINAITEPMRKLILTDFTIELKIKSFVEISFMTKLNGIQRKYSTFSTEKDSLNNNN